MTHTECLDAIEYIQGQLESGYLDLGFHDGNELDIIKTAMEEFLKTHQLIHTDLERRKKINGRDSI